MTNDVPTCTLRDGTTLPAIGLGTYKLNGAAGVDHMVQGIQQGYRLIDSAFSYENEGAVGEAVRQCGVPREQLRIASKLPGRHFGHQSALNAVHESLYRTRLEYFDLYLLHWPNPARNMYVEAWRALIELRDQGLIRSIGVCNFLPEHLERLSDETAELPSVNQIELHPHFPQHDQRMSNKHWSVQTQSWSPLGRASAVLRDPTVDTIAKRHNKTISQTILRWHVQLGSIPLPKSAHAERQSENLDIFDFELTTDEMSLITGLGQHDGRLEDQDPAVYEEF